MPPKDDVKKTSGNVFDLDAVRAAHVEENPLEYDELKLYDRMWKVKTDPNVVSGLEMYGDETQILDFFLSYVAGDEREELKKKMVEDDHMDDVMIGRLMDWILDRTVARPTVPSSPSGDGSSTTGDGSRDASSTMAVPAV
jgi:hypothetical protein